MTRAVFLLWALALGLLAVYLIGVLRPPLRALETRDGGPACAARSDALKGAPLVVVVAHYDEDLSYWLQDDTLPVVICSKADAGDPCCHAAANIGDQHIHYMQWIVANYDCLPLRVAFVDAHVFDWHSDFDMLAYLRCLVHEPDLPSRDLFHPLTTADAQDHAILHQHIALHAHEAAGEDLDGLWAAVSQHNGTAVPDHVAMVGGAQFLVSRDRILRRPRTSWEELLRFIRDHEPPLHSHSPLSYALEYLWHVILFEPLKMDSPVPVLGGARCAQLRRPAGVAGASRETLV